MLSQEWGWEHTWHVRLYPHAVDLMEIPWEPFPTEQQDIGPVLERATRYCDAEQRPYALLMDQGTVAPHPLKCESIPTRANVQCRRNSIVGEPVNSTTREQALREITSAG